LIRRLVLLGLLSLCASAFAGTASTYARPAPDALVLLVFDEPQDDLLARGSAALQRQVQAQLVKAGYRTAVLGEDDFRALEAKVAGSAAEGVLGRLHNSTEATRLRTLPVLARIAKDNSQCDLVLRARLVWRDTIFDTLAVEWDGQRRGVVLEGIADVKTPSGANAHIRRAWMEGSTQAVSVELEAFDGTGAPAFSTFCGALVPWVWNMATKKARVRDDAFQGDGAIADGVRIALEPMR
jgi:hypothetical protein